MDGKNVHDGHRRRMRERFRVEGLEGFSDHEALELLLYYCKARGDVNPLAHRLIDTLGSLQAVMEARPDQLMAIEGVGQETATLIALMLPLFRRYNECICREKKRFDTRTDVKRFCQALLSGWRTERLYAICLNADYQLLGQRLIAEGSNGSVQAHPRLVVEAALNLNARVVVLCHNHPGGSCWPSTQDLDTTEHIGLLLRGLDIDLLDHIIVANDETYSMNEHGQMRMHSVNAPQPRVADGGGQVMRKQADAGKK